MTHVGTQSERHSFSEGGEGAVGRAQSQEGPSWLEGHAGAR